eukprot:860587-Prymnesium_polylepis.1
MPARPLCWRPSVLAACRSRARSCTLASRRSARGAMAGYTAAATRTAAHFGTCSGPVCRQTERGRFARRHADGTRGGRREGAPTAPRRDRQARMGAGRAAQALPRVPEQVHCAPSHPPLPPLRRGRVRRLLVAAAAAQK